MHLVNLLKAEAPGALRFIALMTLVSGAANAALVALINAGASAVYSSEEASKEFFLFLICLIVFSYGKMMAELRGKEVIENAMSGQRQRVFDKLLHARVYAVESMYHSDVIARTSRNVGQVLQASDTIVYGLQSMFMLVFCAIYLLWISPAAFAAVFGGVALLGAIRHFRNENNRDTFEELILRENRQSRFLSDVMDGFKELKINALRRRALHRDYDTLVHETSAMSIRAANDYIRARVVMQATFFIILAVIVFIIPRFTTVYSVQVMEITAVVLFIVGYLTGFLEIIPVFARTNAALQSMGELERELDAAAERHVNDDPERPGVFDGFQRLATRHLTYAYVEDNGERGFGVGPIDLEVERGQILFIVGGNGSGKSTFIKLLTGLYAPTGGQIEIDNMAVTESTVGDLRRLYSIILTDFHLFDRLYGFGGVDEERVNDLIRRMRLEDKVSFRNGAFSTQKLSTGQRKRLALIVAMLEDREIYVFDEWAADQDQHFRKFFYEDMLQDLKKAGKTVIAVTHDEAYWSCADKVVRMDYGRVEVA